MLKKLVGTGFMLSLVTSFAHATDCNIAIDATPSMAFSTKEITIDSKCKQVNLAFKNLGTLSKAVMGHNIVITKKSDMQAVLADGSEAGLSNNYLKENDARVIANTAIIGGGEAATIKIKTDKLNSKETYTFFCSFPGHASVMNGVVKVN
jgi:azurin